MARRPITWTFVFLGGVISLTLAAVRTNALGSQDSGSAPAANTATETRAHRLLALRPETPISATEVDAEEETAPIDENPSDESPKVEVDDCIDSPAVESEIETVEEVVESPADDEPATVRIQRDEEQPVSVKIHGRAIAHDHVPPAPDSGRIPYFNARSIPNPCRFPEGEIDRDVSGIRLTSVRNGGSLPLPTNQARDKYFGNQPPLFQYTYNWGLQQPNRYTYDLYFRSLYYEQPQLERCGRSYGCWTTLASAGTFVADTVLLPYSVLVRCPSTYVTPLGDCTTGHTYPCGITIPRPFEDRGEVIDCDE